MLHYRKRRCLQDFRLAYAISGKLPPRHLQYAAVPGVFLRNLKDGGCQPIALRIRFLAVNYRWPLLSRKYHIHEQQHPNGKPYDVAIHYEKQQYDCYCVVLKAPSKVIYYIHELQCRDPLPYRLIESPYSMRSAVQANAPRITVG